MGKPELVQVSPGPERGWGHGVLRLLVIQVQLGDLEEQRMEWWARLAFGLGTRGASRLVPAREIVFILVVRSLLSMCWISSPPKVEYYLDTVGPI